MNSDAARFQVLDGWRGISILLVLAAHLLPLGPKAWQLNASIGLLGMALFFTLSGFLVTHFLIHHNGVFDFLIRRFCRILPLVWLYMGLMFLLYPVSGDTLSAHFLFYANYPPKPLIAVTDHLWSLCVEMHFYLGIALLVALFKRRGLLLIPAICIAFTFLRIQYDMHYSVITHFRIDEILAGASLALIYNDKFGSAMRDLISRACFPLVLLLLVACHVDSGFMNYFRPYLAAAVVGCTLFSPPTGLVAVLSSRGLFYIASVSYALYVIHPFLMHTWLGSGEGLQKYIKRPLLFAVLFISAHVSTFYYESRWIAFGKKISEKLGLRGLYELK